MIPYYDVPHSARLDVLGARTRTRIIREILPSLKTPAPRL